MIDIANHRFTDVAGRTREAYNDYNALMTDRARMQAGSALSGGDYRGAANALYGSGDVLTGLRVTESSQQRDAKAAELKREQEDEAWKFTGEVAGNLMNALQAGASKEQVINAFDGFASRYEQLGVPADQVAATRDRLLSDPQGTLMALGAGAAKKLGYDTSVVGDELMITSKDTGQVVGRYWGGRTLNVPQGGAVYQIPGGGGPMGDPSQSRTPDFNPQVEAERPPPNMGDVGPALSGRDASSMMDALIAQESGGNGNAVGPQTPYGQAQGSTQMLMETAEGVARKLGIPWNPSLMRGDTPNALAYQRQLGQAYLQEGLDKYGGDIRQALRYYHGGPNEALWGPKTNAYADAVMARMGQGGGALAGGAGSDTVQPSSAPQGARLLVSRPKEREAPSGYRWQGDQLVAVEGGPADKANEPLTPAQVFTQENQLRNQFGGQTAVKDMASVRSHVATIGAIAQKARAGQPVTAADDLALIFAYMKMLDPGSVVREGEFANAQNTAGVPERILNAYNRARSGTRLSDKQRAEFFETASLVMDNYTNAYADQADRSRSVAKSYGLNEDRVAAAPRRAQPRGQGGKPAAPRVGEVRKGYRFKGGNPSSPQSWERVR